MIIKIKLKSTLTINSTFNITINFTSNNSSFSRMKVETRTFAEGTIKVLFYDSHPACYKLNDWTDNNYQVIEIDPTQSNFQTFINAMKSNIEGVELEAGTYLWNNEQPFWGGTDLYRTIILDNAQYVDYDFYSNYVGSKLNKQGGSGGTNKLKFGTETPSKLYMGDSEVTKAYMGETLVYEK